METFEIKHLDLKIYWKCIVAKCMLQSTVLFSTVWQPLLYKLENNHIYES